MRTGRRRWPAIVTVVGLVAVGFLTLTGMSYAQGRSPLGWAGMGTCRTATGFGGASGRGVATLSDAESIAASYIGSYRSSNLEMAEIMEFDNHYYVEVKEESTGRYAFEFLIDRITGRATPEPGPNMMWNLKYGHMGGGMMGGFAYSSNDGDSMSVSEDAAHEAAQRYLDRLGTGLDAGVHAAAFYGYYTLHTLREGQTVGMLSVNGTTGEVWPHTWHGIYLGSLEFDEHDES